MEKKLFKVSLCCATKVKPELGGGGLGRACTLTDMHEICGG